MGYLDNIINLENKLYDSLQNDEQDKFEELLKVRETLYIGFAEESPDQFKNYIESDMFKGFTEKINNLYDLKKESIMNEMKELALSKKAADEYMSNSGVIKGMFSKSV
jgi:hypothetical protein